MSNLESLLNEIEFRSAKTDDLHFIMAAWLNSYRRSQWAGVVPNNMYHKTHRELITQLLARGMFLIVAVNKEDTDQILGFVAAEKSNKGIAVVHYVFVKDEFRRNGLATKLLSVLGVESNGGSFLYTFRTSDARFFKNAKHVPVLARRKELEPVYENQTERSSFQRTRDNDQESIPKLLESRSDPALHDGTRHGHIAVSGDCSDG